MQRPELEHGCSSPALPVTTLACGHETALLRRQRLIRHWLTLARFDLVFGDLRSGSDSSTLPVERDADKYLALLEQETRRNQQSKRSI